MIITIHQPEHLPWLGFFNKMSKAEVFVILDSVQYRKNYFQNRNRIMGTNEPQWINIPIDTKGHMSMNICDMQISNKLQNKWKEKYLKTIEYSYSKHPYFGHYFPFFKDLLQKEHNSLCDLNIEIIKYLASELDLQPKFIRSSELNVDGLKSELILNICKTINADIYVAGPSGRDYLNLDEFKQNDIEVIFNDFEHPKYEQKKSKEFVPFLSILDLLMNVGSLKAREITIKNKF